MVTLYVIEFYCPFLLLPLWFISYAFLRCLKHWNDGKDRLNLCTKSLMMKYACTISMVIFCCFHGFYIVPNCEYKIDETTVRIFFWILLGISWALSFYLIIFENRRRLYSQWIGQRGFWVLNMGLNLYFTVLQLTDPMQNDEYLAEERIITFLLSWAVCFLLAVYAIFKLNEFTVAKVGTLLTSVKDIDWNNSARKGMVMLEEVENKMINTSIKECKIKTENSRQIIYYLIVVTVGNSVHTVRKTICEFEMLYNRLREKFNKEEYPNLDFPQFPILSAKAGLDERISSLDKYLKKICYPEFMTDFLLNFLHIEGNDRISCIEANKTILGEDRVSTSMLSGNSFHNSFTVTYFSPNFTQKEDDTENCPKSHLHDYVKISIDKWVLEKNHVEYIIQWDSNGQSGEINRRYNDFFELHNKLRKIVCPAKLPKFPKKNYLSNFRKTDTNAIEIRKIQLENYLGYILNDPAFQCREALEFIEYNTTLEALWKIKPQGISYILQAPVAWDKEIDKDSNFILYSMNFAKFYKNKKIDEWTVKRRYKDFNHLHSFLSKRLSSPLLSNYLKQSPFPWFRNSCITCFPSLPGKTLTALSSSEIEIRRASLHEYLEALLSIPHTLESCQFRSFINDKEFSP